jgi:hypothetical protein
MISKVIVNHDERNYFNDYEEVRSDEMMGVEPEKLVKAIDKLVRRYHSGNRIDCMFVKNDDGTGWRLMYDIDPELFERGVEEKVLRLRHYTSMAYNSWDTDVCVSVMYAKKTIIGEEQQ